MKNFLLALVISTTALMSCNSSATTEQSSTTSGNALPKDSVIAIAKSAFVFGLPLFLMDVTKNSFTNVEMPVPGLAAPLNQFTVSTKFPPQDETVVVRPNAD